MEIKDLTKETEKNVREARAEAAGLFVERFQVPETSSCITDIDKFCGELTEVVLNLVKKLNEEKTESSSAHQNIIGTCAGLISLIDQYKNVRLSVEFSRRMKFETCPRSPSTNSEKPK